MNPAAAETESQFNNIKPGDLPMPPQTALQVLRACAREDVATERLAGLVAVDPGLTAELLRLVNSALFGLARKVASIDQAIIVIGRYALRNMVLCLSVHKALDRQIAPGFDCGAFWEDAMRRATAARQLSGVLKLDAEECFTAGLLQDIGLLALFQMHPEKAGFWEPLRAADPDQRLQRELDLFSTTHCIAGRSLAEVWEFPSELSQVLGDHHRPNQATEDAAANPLSRILCCADWINAVFIAANTAEVLEHARDLAYHQLGLDQKGFDSLMNQLPGQVEQAAQALNLPAAPQQDFEEILRRTSLCLATETVEYQQLNWRLQRALEERDRLADELNRELELAREIQRSFLPASLREEFSVTGINVPAHRLSGDFFDHFRIEDGRICFCLGDVAGKGTNAAILMAKTCSLFRCLGKHIRDPARLMSIINAELCETAIRGLFVTMVTGIYDPKSQRISLVNAGHLPALLVGKNGQIQTFEAQSAPLGIFPQSEFSEAQLSLGGSSLYLFSDGLTEARVANGGELGIDGLIALLAKLRHHGPSQRLDALFSLFQGQSIIPHDDMTLLLVE